MLHRNHRTTELRIMTENEQYSLMEKEQLISLIHSLVKRDEKRAQENQDLKDLVKELRDIRKEDMKNKTLLMDSVDNLTKRVSELTEENKVLQMEVERLMAEINR